MRQGSCGFTGGSQASWIAISKLFLVNDIRWKWSIDGHFEGEKVPRYASIACDCFTKREQPVPNYAGRLHASAS